MHMQSISKKMWIIGGIVGITVIVGILLIIRGRSGQSANAIQNSSQSLSQGDAPVPTVDSSVSVDLQQKVLNKEVVLAINHVPDQTTSIDYSLTYNTKKQNAQGVIGTINVTDVSQEYDKQITLGTCSSGTCVYHDVVGPITVSLQFNGPYGQKVFEKAFSF